MRILYLYSEVMGYTMATINELSTRYDADIHIVHWDSGKLTPFRPNYISNVTFYARSLYSTPMIRELALRISPDLVVVSGWMDKGYLKIASMLKKKNTAVVVGFDGQWNGSMRQYTASLLRFYLKRIFSHAWVTGPYQFEYARRLGFDKKEIIFDLYSADTSLFNARYSVTKQDKANNYPHRFLFVGRLEKIKAVDLLVDAWINMTAKRKDWELVLIGNGSLKGYLKAIKEITLKDFMHPDCLSKETMGAGCFILPSRVEPWGVVIHEFAAAGLPLICSDVCGAAQIFLIPGLNGFRFESGNTESLTNTMLKIINTDDEVLCKMSEWSHILAQRITPETSAANLISITS